MTATPEILHSAVNRMDLIHLSDSELEAYVDHLGLEDWARLQHSYDYRLRREQMPDPRHFPMRPKVGGPGGSGHRPATPWSGWPGRLSAVVIRNRAAAGA